MGFAPLAFLRGREPPRTVTAHLNPCHMVDSQERDFRIEYYEPAPEQPFSFKQVFPGRKPSESHEPSLFVPPPHYHLCQNEHFKVDSGEGIWHLWGGKTVRLKKGDEILVPKWKWHWFETAPESTEPFSVMYRYDKEYTSMETTFFKNVLPGLIDHRKAGKRQSLFGLCVFCRHNWMAIAFLKFGPERLNFFANVLLMLILAFIGEYLLGYPRNHPEYYSEKEDSKL